jgi:IclR family transcriptional regulator, acetate operon repressor
MFTEVGRRVLPHCTAVGKAIMAGMPEDQVLDLLRRTGMPEHTEHTITDPDAFAAALLRVAESGYAIDDEEQEHGVRCVAVAVPDAPTKLGLSVSGPATRMTPAVVERAVPILRAAATALSHDLA